MSIFRRKNYVRRLDRLDYSFTLGDFWMCLGDVIFRAYPYLLGVSLALMLYYTLLVEGDGKWMSSWFSDTTKRDIRNVIELMFIGGCACIPVTLICERILGPLFSIFKREWHNYTVLMFFVATILLKLQEHHGWWLGFAAIPGVIFFAMLVWSVIVGILDLIF